MTRSRPLLCSKQYTGFSLIEVLVTIVILLIGLLGLAGLQGKALNSQLESYQRSQALVLLKDMEDRINANRKNAAAYVTSTPLGAGAACPAAGATTASVDLNEWCNAIMGAAEVQSGAGAAGAMIGARGCIYQTAASAVGVPAQYMIAVAWQGLNSTAAQSSVLAGMGNCGSGQYGNENQRRVVTLPVFVGVLN